ncbi:hypothetical protein RP20_CCG020393 [Aedes albopictus]|nr:hypothetical protein RP20_CCG020393 [Aedes albopictus]
MDSPTLSLNDLPVEILEQIFSYLPLSDRKAVSLVCQAWNEIVFSRRFMKSVALNVIMDWEQSQVHYLRASTRRYRRVFIFLGPETCCEFDFTVIIEILDLFGNDLESFHCMSGFTEEQLWKVIIRAPNLQQLIVGVDAESLKHERSFPVLGRLQDLGSLVNVLQIRGLDMPKLTQLSANFTTASDALGSIDLLRRLTPQLRNLELFSMEYYFSIDELRCPKVEVLKLAGQICAGSDLAVRSFFGGFQCLKDVRLEFNVTDRILDVITQTCPRIENLHFKSDLLSSDTFQLLERLKSLKTLSIMGSIDFRIALECKPLVSVKRFRLQLVILDDGTRIFGGFKKMLPNVNDISVKLVTHVQPERALVHVCRSFPHIRRLTIADATTRIRMLSCTTFQNLRNLYRLEELTLKSIHVPVAFMHRNKCLKRLKIKYFHWLTDGDLIMLADLYPNLKYLELSWCRKVSIRGVEEFRARLPDCVVHCIQSRL